MAGTASARGALGRFGEELAAQHLQTLGMTILARNWRCRSGELDIVARDGDTLVVCEVKTRRGVGFGGPLESVTPRKAARLRQLAVAWLTEHAATRVDATDGTRGYTAIRFDVVAILHHKEDGPTIEYVRGAF
ncbi:MAG: YraN family protein [Acidothermus cellulolyticus]|nr:YraN family protein [Acidothermus cellulolyticus]